MSDHESSPPATMSDSNSGAPPWKADAKAEAAKAEDKPKSYEELSAHLEGVEYSSADGKTSEYWVVLAERMAVRAEASRSSKAVDVLRKGAIMRVDCLTQHGGCPWIRLKESENQYFHGALSASGPSWMLVYDRSLDEVLKGPYAQALPKNACEELEPDAHPSQRGAVTIERLKKKVALREEQGEEEEAAPSVDAQRSAELPRSREAREPAPAPGPAGRPAPTKPRDSAGSADADDAADPAADPADLLDPADMLDPVETGDDRLSDTTENFDSAGVGTSSDAAEEPPPSKPDGPTPEREADAPRPPEPDPNRFTYLCTGAHFGLGRSARPESKYGPAPCPCQARARRTGAPAGVCAAKPR